MEEEILMENKQVEEMPAVEERPVAEEKRLAVGGKEQAMFGELGKWSRVLGVLCAIYFVMLIVLGIVYIVVGIVLDGTDVMKSASIICGIVFILLDVLMYFPTKFLLKAGGKLKSAASLCDQESFTEGVKNTKSFYKFTAIYCLVFLPLSIILGLIGGILSIL